MAEPLVFYHGSVADTLILAEDAVGKRVSLPTHLKPELESVGLDAAMIMDFHGDGHPTDTTRLRSRELEAYYEAHPRQSDSHFLLIPAEKADVYPGGH